MNIDGRAVGKSCGYHPRLPRPLPLYLYSHANRSFLKLQLVVNLFLVCIISGSTELYVS